MASSSRPRQTFRLARPKRNPEAGIRAAPVTRADVVIVGAGPAGATTAMLLARAGLDVVLLDRHEFPRTKACGDCLSPNATRWLAHLGLLDEVESTQPARLDGWRIFAPGGSLFEARFTDLTSEPLVRSGIAITRRVFDRILVDAAVNAGAIVLTGMRVEDLLPDRPGVAGRATDGRPFAIEARLVIGADGLRSVVARRMNAVARPARVHKVSLTAHMAGVMLAGPFGEMHLADGMCAGLAPVSSGSDVCNVTVVADGRHGRDLARDPASFFHRSLDRFSGLTGRFENASFVRDEDGTGRIPQLLACGPFDVPTTRVVDRGLALVGDAAGYFDPFTGQGIHAALEGAHLLADDAVPRLVRDSTTHPRLDRYAGRMRALIRGRHAVQRIIDAVISRPRIADPVIARLAQRPTARNALLATTGDLASASSLFSPAVLFSLAGPPRQEAMLH